MFQTIMAYFGYVKIPDEAIQLSLVQEQSLSLLIDKADVNHKIRNLFVKQLEGQKELTKFLQSGRFI